MYVRTVTKTIDFGQGLFDEEKVTFASAGNRTRAARVAGEHSTTEPPMLDSFDYILVIL